MSSEIVVKLIIDASADASYENYDVIKTATVRETTELGHHCFAWSDDDWSKLGHEDLIPLHEWMDIELDNELTDIPFQYVCLVKDDTYLTCTGNPYYGIKVNFSN